MSELKVCVCDDISERGRRTVEKIRNMHRVEIDIRPRCLFEDELSVALKRLFDRVRRLLPPDGTASSETGDALGPTEFDHEIVVIDNNLAALNIEGVRLTAEAVAGFVRAFTKAGYVVSLNKNPEVDFDLRYLVGDYQTQADLALNASHLSNPALWTGNARDAEDGFLPWYWPALGNVAKKRSAQIEFLNSKKRLESPIIEALDFHQASVDHLSRHAVGALTPPENAEDTGVQDSIPLHDVTFMDFFLHSCRSLPAYADRHTLNNQAADGSECALEIIARVVAAEIDKWFRRDVLGPQDVLVDVPHLLMRMPFLLGDKVTDLDWWHGSLSLQEPPFGLNREVYCEHVSDARFSHDHLMKSPCFWWPKLKENQVLNDLFFESRDNWPDVVFCEDASQFRSAVPNGGSIEPMQFSAEFEGSWSRRYVSLLPGKIYSPQSRFAR
ncbi:MAG: hypothetical protein OXI15_11215 [Chromatiales bacterium]|nr:hypothetical protein [Chromatiales bacterium]